MNTQYNQSPVAAAPAGGSETVSPTSGGTKRFPIFALAPVAVLAVACVGAATQRAVAHRAGQARALSASAQTPFGKISDNDARRIADTACSEMTGAPAATLDATRQTAYSSRRRETVREWNVICNTPAAVYLVRINANTGKIYAINRMGEGGMDNADALARLQGDIRSPEAAETVSSSDSVGACTDDAQAQAVARVRKTTAEAQARRFLQVAGVPEKGLRPISEGVSCGTHQDAQWNFTYRRHVPGLGNRLVKVSVDGTSGQLAHMWNPVSAM